jgi:hypothetical protein
VAEAAGDAARQVITRLEEEVAFLQEQVQSSRAYIKDLVEGEIAHLHDERAALLEENRLLNDELQGRASADARLTLERTA